MGMGQGDADEIEAEEVAGRLAGGGGGGAGKSGASLRKAAGAGLKSGAGAGVPKGRAVGAKPGKRQLDDFLDCLAETSNVTASARAAGLTSSAIYRERRRNAEFAARWHEALCEGFVRLETELLSEALMAASGNVKDATLKARAQKYRLGLALLAAHRAAVRGVKALPSANDEDGKGAKERLKARLMEMRERAAPRDDGLVAGPDVADEIGL